MLTNAELIDERNKSIVVSNKLIQNSYFDLNMIPLKTLLYCISKIRESDIPHKEYKISIRELCQVCNMRIKGTNTYKGRTGIVYKAMRELRGQHLDLYDSKGRAFNTGWFSSVSIDEDNDTVSYWFDVKLMPYLFNLTKEIGNFTITTMEICCSLETPQGIRLYLFLRSIASLGIQQRITLDEIRERTGNAGRYGLYADVRRFILTPAVDDINKYSDIEVSYSAHREGKKVVAIDFTIKQKKIMDKNVLDDRRHNRYIALYGKRNPNRWYKMERDTTKPYTNRYRKAKPTGNT